MIFGFSYEDVKLMIPLGEYVKLGLFIVKRQLHKGI